MLFGNDCNGKRVHISETVSGMDYFCPCCGAPLDLRKGEIRQHYFAHKKGQICTDNWSNTNGGGYDISPWHNDWQSFFPKENQEINLRLGKISHRADIIIDRTVVEFQHGVTAVKLFDDKNSFYSNLGYKVIWLFDMTELYEGGQIAYSSVEKGLAFTWKSPKKAFNQYDIQYGCIDLFLQFGENIVRVLDVSENGFEEFSATPFMSKEDFLEYVGLHEGKCLPPCRFDQEQDEQYRKFKQQYNITLNRQQERALQAVDGYNLLLAVPGSGKTTVLVARLGYMVLVKHIPPENILAITYGRAAAKEMQERYCAKFGEETSSKIQFRTINSLSLAIYRRYCEEQHRPTKQLIQDWEKNKILREILKNYTIEYITENDLLEFSKIITCVKNLMLTENDIRDMEDEYPHLLDKYRAYQKKLYEMHRMDFDDQMCFAYRILCSDEGILNAFRQTYKYICVDEAQDTSKIQHALIRILSSGNLFMVGDEDQSIYGFRGAYPQALLNFKYDYPNPYILRMERNYRSTPQIVDAAQDFISEYRGRYEKNMVSERGEGEDLSLISVTSREEQYNCLLDVAKEAKTETAFLYRDNESAVVLADLLLRSGIPFKLKKPEANFFDSHVIRDVVAHLRLAIDEYDAKQLAIVCNKGILYLKEKQRFWAIRNCMSRHISVYDALEEQMQYGRQIYSGRAGNFRSIMENAAKAEPTDAIELLLDAGYRQYMKASHLDSGKVEILQILAKQEKTIDGFLKRLQELETFIKQGFEPTEDSKIVLSTIHTAKGLEYDTVYMVDVFDGRFPSTQTNSFSKDSADGGQEERRLFYVGITRAKNRLNLFAIKDKKSSFVKELLA